MFKCTVFLFVQKEYIMSPWSFVPSLQEEVIPQLQSLVPAGTESGKNTQVVLFYCQICQTQYKELVSALIAFWFLSFLTAVLIYHWRNPQSLLTVQISHVFHSFLKWAPSPICPHPVSPNLSPNNNCNSGICKATNRISEIMDCWVGATDEDPKPNLCWSTTGTTTKVRVQCRHNWIRYNHKLQSYAAISSNNSSQSNPPLLSDVSPTAKFVPMVILLWLYREPQPQKNPEGPTPQAPNPTSKKTPTPKTLFKTQTPKLQPPSHHKN